MKTNDFHIDLTEADKQHLVAKIKASTAYKIAFEDMDFMDRRDLRPVRLQLELLKPETLLREHKIHSTIVVFGSARLISEDSARKNLAEAKRHLAKNPKNRTLIENLRLARLRLGQSHYYEEARRFSYLISRAQQSRRKREFVIVTGGGPGIMEAANRGAFEAGSKSIGLNITLPQEQDPNPFISPDLCFQFHYFSLRKMHFLMRAKAMVAFPGGYGTCDELFETLTLVQTGKKKPFPIVLFGKKYWERALNIPFLAEQGMISWEDVKLLKMVETAQEGWAYIRKFWAEHKTYFRPGAGV
jgi:uncharacterized protein (TIGR00730 family)